MFDIGPGELTIVLLIVVLLFGPGRIGKVASELGKGIRAFRDGVRGTETPGSKKEIDGESEPGSEK